MLSMKFFVCLTRKTADHVGSDRDVRNDPSEFCSKICKSAGCGLAAHPAQSRGTARLKRQMQVRAQARVLPQLEQPSVDVPRLERGKSYPGKIRFAQDRFDQILNPHRLVELVTPRAQVDAGQYDLFDVFGGLEFSDDL